MIYKRGIETEIEKHLFKGKIVAIYGARRVGKTTLVKNLLNQHSQKGRYLSCDEPDVRQALTNKTSSELINYLGNNKLVVIDEAQRVKNIGITLKLLIDSKPEMQIVATGSSSFDLSNKIKEPLTGRVSEFLLYPLSTLEISNNDTEIKRLLESRLIYGTYPEVVTNQETAKETLQSIYKNYLYKDALEFQGLKNPEMIEKLLTALALQVGQEVSYTELANLVGIDQKTIITYIRLLELAFVIFRISPLSRNLRKEISKSRKIYFYDLGIRNAVINNFNPIHMRSDVGQLWENFAIVERAKRNECLRVNPNRYFWRTWDKQEIDYIEEEGGTMNAFEIKWSVKEKIRQLKIWKETYPNSKWNIINRENFIGFLK